MVNDVLELVGFLLFLAFWAVCWPPAVLLFAGLGLMTAAAVRDRQAARRPPTPEMVDELRRRRARAELEKLTGYREAS